MTERNEIQRYLETGDNKPVVPRRALRFGSDADLLDALRLVQSADPGGESIIYDVLPSSGSVDPGLLLTESAYERVLSLIENGVGDQIRFREVKAMPVSGLPVEQQAIIKHRRGAS